MRLLMRKIYSRDVAVATFSINANSKIVEIAEKNSQNWSPGKWRRNWQTAATKTITTPM